MSNLYEFLNFMNSKGYNCFKPINYNSFIRFGKNCEYWLIFHGECGFFGNWKTGEKFYWFPSNWNNKQYYEKSKYSISRAQFDKKILEQQEKTAREAQKIYRQASLKGFSPYLNNKNLGGLNNA